MQPVRIAAAPIPARTPRASISRGRSAGVTRLASRMAWSTRIASSRDALAVVDTR